MPIVIAIEQNGWLTAFIRTDGTQFTLRTIYKTEEEAAKASMIVPRPAGAVAAIERAILIVLEQAEYAYMLRYANLVRVVQSLKTMMANGNTVDVGWSALQVNTCQREIRWASQHLEEIAEASHSFDDFEHHITIYDDPKADKRLQHLLTTARELQHSDSFESLKQVIVEIARKLDFLQTRDIQDQVTTKIVTEQDDDPLDYHPRPIQHIPKIPSRQIHAPGSRPARYDNYSPLDTSTREKSRQ